MTPRGTPGQPPLVHSYRLTAIAAIVLAASGCASPGLQRGHADPGRTGKSADSRDQHQTARLDDASHQGMPSSSATRLKKALHRVYNRWHGTPYRYGGQSRDGVDCSSFVRQAIDTVESHELPRTTVEQAQAGVSIPRSHLETSDLVFFKTGNLSHHVGIYLGEGRFMHASTNQGVTISRLDNVYWRNHYWQSRRILAASRM